MIDKHVIFLGFFLALILSTSLNGQLESYAPKGPDETAAFEMELYNLLGGYVIGIYPRQEIISLSQVNESRLKSQSRIRIDSYKNNIEFWLKEFLVPQLMPKEFRKEDWICLDKLRWNTNFIIGNYLVEANEASVYRNAKVEFQADGYYLGISIYSKNLLNLEPNTLSDNELANLIFQILSIPKEKQKAINIDKNLLEKDSINLCYGKIKIDWQEEKDKDISEIRKKQWFSDISFWFTRGKIFIAISTIAWEKGPPSNAGNIWDFDDAVNEVNETTKN